MYKQILFMLFGVLSFHALQAQAVDTTLAHQQLVKAKLFADSLQYDSAVFNYKAAAANFEKASAWKRFVYCKNHAGKCLRKKGKYDDAFFIFQEALESGLLHFDTLHQEVAKSLYGISVVYFYEGNYEKAMEYSHKSLNIRLILSGKDHPNIADNYNVMGLIYDRKGNCEKALGYHHKSLNIKLMTLGEQHPSVVKSYNNIGSVFYRKGNYKKALEYYHKSLNTRLVSSGEQHPFVAASYNNIGVIYNDKANYEKALEFYGKAVAIRLRCLGEDHPDVGTSYNNIGVVYNKKRDYDNALMYYEKAVNIRLKCLGKNHPNVAVVYNNIGIVYNRKRDYSNALMYYQKAMRIRLERFGTDHPEVAASYNNIGAVYDKRGDSRRALGYHQKALNIRLRLFDEQHPSVAASYNNIGAVYDKKGDSRRALGYHQKALNIRLRLFGEQHPSVAASYNNIGAVYDKKGDSNKALEYYQKALQIRLQYFGKQHPNVADNYNDIGFIYNKKSDIGRALEAYQKALEIRLALSGEQHLDVADNYNNIGFIYNKKGDSDNALKYYKKALSVRRMLLGEEHPNVAASYNNIGAIYNKKRDSNKALGYHQKALRIRLNQFGEEHPGVAASYNNIGLVYSNKDNDNKALAYHQRALRIRLKQLGRQHPDVAASYNNIGLVYNDKGDTDQALEYCKKALRIRLRHFGEDHPNVLISYNNTSNVYYIKGNNEKALEYSQKALGIGLKCFGEQHPNVAFSYNQIGLIHNREGSYDKALRYYQKAIIANIPDFKSELINENPDLNVNVSDRLLLLRSLQLKANALISKRGRSKMELQRLKLAIETYALASELLGMIRKSYASENARLDLGGKSEEIYTRAIPVCLEVFEATKERKYLDIAFKFAEKGKATVLSYALQETAARQFSGIPDSLSERERALKINQSFYQQQVLEARNDSTKMAENQNCLFKANRAWEAFVQQLEREYPKYYELKYKTDLANIDSVQNELLDSQSALIEYVVSDKMIWVFTLTKDSVFYKSIMLPSDFKESIGNFIEQINSIPNISFSKIFSNYKNTAHQYYRLLLHPILSDLDTAITQLHIIADGVLNYLPFEVLLIEEPNIDSIENRQVNYSFAHLPYLVKYYSINYNYSSTLALRMMKAKKQHEGKVEVLAFAPFAEQTRAGELESICQRSSSTPLPGSWDEIKAIAKYFDGYYYSKENATESIFKKQAAVGDYAILHISSHGEVLKDSLNTNALIHFSVEKNDTLEDNKLHSYEIYNLMLNIRLVVLSACETGHGKHQKGEGLMSLSRAFSYAGCPALVMTLWRVNDSSSAKIMASFYEGLSKGLSKEVALQQAKLKYLEEEQNNAPMRTRRLTAHPYYWAGYVGLGNKGRVN